jgi:hypothetical protein
MKIQIKMNKLIKNRGGRPTIQHNNRKKEGSRNQCRKKPSVIDVLTDDYDAYDDLVTGY